MIQVSLVLVGFVWVVDAVAPTEQENAVLQYAKQHEDTHVICKTGYGAGECWDLAACAVLSAGIGPTWDCVYSAEFNAMVPFGWTPEADSALRLAHRQRYSGNDYNVTAFSNELLPLEPLRQHASTMATPEPVQTFMQDHFTMHPNCYVWGTPITPGGQTGMWQDVWLGQSTTFTQAGVIPGDILQLDQFTAHCYGGYGGSEYATMYYSTGHMHTAVVYQVLDRDLVVCEQNFMGDLTDRCTHHIFETLSKCPPGKWQFSYNSFIIYRPTPNGGRGPSCTLCPDLPGSVADLHSTSTSENIQSWYVSQEFPLIAGLFVCASVACTLFAVLRRRSFSVIGFAREPLLA